jgi:hypothetical protein
MRGPWLNLGLQEKHKICCDFTVSEHALCDLVILFVFESWMCCTAACLKIPVLSVHEVGSDTLVFNTLLEKKM